MWSITQIETALLLACTLLLAITCCGQWDSALANPPSGPGAGFEERFYRFPQGSRWTFDCDFVGAKRKAVITLSEARAGFSYIEYDLYNSSDPGATASLDEAWYVESGFVVWGSYDPFERKVSPYWRVFKIGAKPGDSWETLPGIGLAKYVGSVEVTVPAGSFRDVALVTLTDEDGKDHAFYYAAGTGLVLWDTRGPRGNVRFVLREFLPGSR